ncbi:MAG: hypothetical protein HOV68_13615 [Streptomycetaceae bacterium]|nr:hypothetical protein [Streptomycetaceae bacterium]
MDVTAFGTLLDQLDSADGVLADRLGAELPEHVLRQRTLPTRMMRARTTVYHFPGEAPTVRTWRLTGAHVACLVEGAAPAATTLRMLRRLAPKHEWAYLDGTRGLAASLRERLGADPAAWRHVQRELTTYTGVLPELLDDAARASRTASVGGADVVTRVPAAPRHVRMEMRQLLMLLDRDTLAALAPHLDRRTILDLVRFGAALPPETLAWVVATASARERLTLAKARWSRPELAAALAELHDSEINAALYLNAHTSVAVRARIMAAADRVPLHSSVVARVRSDNSRSMRLPALWSGDPLLVRAALLRRTYTSSSVQECMRVWERDGVDALAALYRGYAPTDTSLPPFRLPRYRSLLLVAVEGVWRRHGGDEAARLVDELPVVPRDRRHFAELFAAADGLERLRAEIAAKTGTRVLLKRLRRDSPTKLWPLLETPETDWELLARAGRTRPLNARAWALLAGSPGCPERVLPEDFTAEFGAAPTGPGHWPTGSEVHVPREWTGSGYKVAEPARRGAVMPPEYLFGGVAPAARALNTYACVGELASDAPVSLRYHAHLRTLVDRHLGGSTEARVVAMRLLADFVGTTEELLETAGAMALATA